MIKIYRWMLSLSLHFYMFIFSAIPLSIALLAQYYFKFIPCELCYYERIPYLITTIISLLAIYLIKNTMPLQRYRYLYGFIFIISVFLSCYHVAVEQKWIVHRCVSRMVSEEVKMDDMDVFFEEFETIGAQPPCDQVALSFLGLSLSAWNALYSLCLILLPFLYCNIKLKFQKSKDQ